MIIVKLYDLMWQHRVKGYELAKATGLGTATISRLLQGKDIDLKLSTVEKLCDFFNCRVEDLLEYKK